MSGSLGKKKNIANKQNSNRISNSKLLLNYSNAPLTKVAEFFHNQVTAEDKNHSKRGGKIKTNRKHQLSVEYILQNKYKQPYSLRSMQIIQKQKDKTKIKKKKKEGYDHESNAFVIPVLDFSRSNSLIVFSEKDSTINGNAHRQKKNFFIAKPFTPTQAAIIIQKNWRGYLTRKLLQQYINQQESKLVSAMNFLKSKEESFIDQKNQSMNFSEFSEIKEEFIPNYAGKNTQKSQRDVKSNSKRYQNITTEHESERKEYTYSTKRFFGTKTEPDFQSSKKQSTKKVNKFSLSLYSSLIDQKIFVSRNKQQVQNQGDFEQKINQLKYLMSLQLKAFKAILKHKLEGNQISMQEMFYKNNKIKQTYINSQEFLDNVLEELKAMKIDMLQTAEDNGQNPNLPRIPVHLQPKSEVFTFDAEDSQPDMPAQQCSTEGQLKIQSYLSDLLFDYSSNYKEMSQLEYLCQILKINSQRGIKTMVERCLLQFTVQIITSNYSLDNLNKIVAKKQFEQSEEQLFIIKWINELNKWEMGPIQEVTQAMESSSIINQSTIN